MAERLDRIKSLRMTTVEFILPLPFTYKGIRELQKNEPDNQARVMSMARMYGGMTEETLGIAMMIVPSSRLGGAFLYLVGRTVNKVNERLLRKS